MELNSTSCDIVVTENSSVDEVRNYLVASGVSNEAASVLHGIA